MFGKSRGKHGWSSRPTRYSHMCFFKSKWKHACRFGRTGRKKHYHIIQEDSFLFGSFHAICHLLTLTAPSYRGSPPIQETNLDPFFTHLQYCGRLESETDKAKLPWQRHIVPIHSQQQVGWIPRLIRTSGRSMD